jgi:uncharacterized membrane protein HdeD (DUF308 family)
VDEHTHQIEDGTVLGWACIILLAALQAGALVAGFPVPAEPQTGLAILLIGVMFVALGAMLLASYYYPHKSFFFRWLMRIVERSAWPASRKWVFAWVVVSLVGGTIAIFRGLGAEV